MGSRLACLGILLVACTAGSQPAPDRAAPSGAQADRPNVLVIVSDDQGYGDLSLHGNTRLPTPHLDQLGTNSIRFDRFYVSPLCAPTRASLLTGRYSLRTGTQGVSRGQETMRSEEITFAEVLRDAGWRTGYFGKWHNGENFPFTPRGQGFDTEFGFNLGHWNNYFDTALKSNGVWVSTSGYITDLLTDSAMEFISRRGTEPWLCYLAYNVPHSPFQVPDRHFDRFKNMGLDDRLAAIHGMVENMDENIGRLLNRLKETGQADNTIVLFLSDNGPNGERFNDGMRGVKGSLHEGGSRVPCFLRWPARFPEPAIIPQIAAHIDWYPTVLELCGLTRPDGPPVDGLSLVPLLEGRTNHWPDRILFGQHQAGDRADHTGSLRTQRFRLVNEGGGWELFDMQNDPGQERDVAKEFSEETRRLVAAYEGWWRNINAEMPESPPPIPVGHTEEPRVELLVPQSQFTGGLRFNGRYPNNAWLTDWTNATAQVEWRLNIVRSGLYEVTLQYLCPEDSAGSKVRVWVGDSAVETTIQGTRVRQIHSPDRFPRGEVYEMQWFEQAVGLIQLPEGAVTLVVDAVEMTGQSVMDLKAVILSAQR